MAVSGSTECWVYLNLLLSVPKVPLGVVQSNRKAEEKEPSRGSEAVSAFAGASQSVCA